MKKKCIWICILFPLVLLLLCLFLFPINGNLYLNMNSDNGLNSYMYNLNNNRSNKIVINGYEDVIDYYPLSDGYVAIGVNYVPTQDRLTDGFEGEYCLVIHKKSHEFSYSMNSSASIMCVYDNKAYFALYGDDDAVANFYTCSLSDFKIEKLPTSVVYVASDSHTFAYVKSVRNYEQVVLDLDGSENVIFLAKEIQRIDILQNKLLITYDEGQKEKCVMYNLSTGELTNHKKVSDSLEYAATLNGHDWYIHKYEIIHNDYGTPLWNVVVMRSGVRVKFLIFSPTSLGSPYLLQ